MKRLRKGLVGIVIVVTLFAGWAAYSIPIIPIQHTAFCSPNTVLGCGFCRGTESITAWLFGFGANKTTVCAVP